MRESFIYDIETYPNIFSCVAQRVSTGKVYTFEVSSRLDQRDELVKFINAIGHIGGRMVGYNNQSFDYPVLHELLKSPSTWDWFAESQRCIESEGYDHIIWRPAVPQIDLLKIHHFDNNARRQSLKGLEFALKMDNIQDLPFEVGTHIPEDKMDLLLHYNRHDVKATRILYDRTLDAIEFRDSLSKKYDKNFTNFSDVKCGSEVLIMEAEMAVPHSCYEEGSRVPKQTKRDNIIIDAVLLPSIKFERPEFQKIHAHFKDLVVIETKGAIKGLTATVDDFKFVYGLGGLHGSVESQAVHSDDEYVIVDVDVASYYPNLAIVNGMYPEHLSSNFCDVYKSLYEERKKHPKGTAENAMLKLALNGAYGNSNNPYSPLFDPQYTMAVTINGQLLLSMLAERLMTINDLSIIQVNTDGITVRVPRYRRAHLSTVCQWWQDMTGLVLEDVEFKSMYIRDVNNFLAIYGNGGVKRKGAYEYEYQLHQDPSATVVAMACEAHLISGVDIEEFIMGHEDPHSFVLRAKMTGANRCVHGGVRQQKVTRYHMSISGDSLIKWMPASGPKGTYKRKNKLEDSFYNSVLRSLPEGTWDERIHTKNKSVYEDRESVIAGGNPVVICNNMKDFDWSALDHSWYITEAIKLIEVFGK